MSDFSIDYLDHVAIRVKNIDASARWYENVLGLTRKEVPEWGDYPIFLLTGKTGIALFPATLDDPILEASSRALTTIACSAMRPRFCVLDVFCSASFLQLEKELKMNRKIIIRLISYKVALYLNAYYG